MAFQAAHIAANITLFFLAKFENVRRDREQGERMTEVEEDAAVIMAGLEDETDKRNLRFRYHT